MTTEKALTDLKVELKHENRYSPISFAEFLKITEERPRAVFRDIYQLFFDMIHYYVPEGINEYPNDPESVGFLKYDFSKLFVQGNDKPFFADRLLSNRIMNCIGGFRNGLQNNKIFLFEGPTGSGKSVFLNNLISKFEEYTKFSEGETWETFWRIDLEESGGRTPIGFGTSEEKKISNKDESDSDKILEISCPSHDHPILQIPKEHRKKFLEDLINDEEFKKKLFTEKEYEWVLEEEPCSICTSVYQRLLKRMENVENVLRMISPRRYQFNKHLGEGVSIFNPGDPINKGANTNTFLQERLGNLFRDSNAVTYVFSNLAKTNNGIYALMDVKDENFERFNDLHGIVSEGVHKVFNVEERIRSLLIGLANPEDVEDFKQIPSFNDRIQVLKIPYVLDYNTEVKIYENQFSKDLRSYFLPGVLESFAKIIISSRMEKESKTMHNWLGNASSRQYSKFLDKNSLLLKMDIYTGFIPLWLSEEHRRTFSSEIRKAIILESELEGILGFSGRESIQILNEFLALRPNHEKLIDIDMVFSFFKEREDKFGNQIEDYDFVDKVLDFYDFNLLQQMRESIHPQNEDKISKEVQNYIYAVNCKLETRIKCPFTDEEIEITEDYFKNFESILIGKVSDSNREAFRDHVQKNYVSKTLAQEINVQGKKLIETEQYGFLFEKYIKNSEENSLLPLTGNKNFKKALIEHGKESFNKYDRILKYEINSLITNLQKKFGYTEEGARQVCIYAIERDLPNKF